MAMSEAAVAAAVAGEEPQPVPAGHERWRDEALVRPWQVPPVVRPWLLSTDSLTRRLVHACGGDFAVAVLCQQWTLPRADERALLGLGPRQRALVRQVQLRCHGETWVYARTVMPRQTLRGRQRRLAKLGGRSLGALLFRDASLRRGVRQVARLSPGQPSYEAALGGLGHTAAAVWGRRSVFLLATGPLLVSEIFLPPLAE